MKAPAIIWWEDLGSFTKQYYQIRYYPATNWLYLTDKQIKNIYNKEKQLTNED